MIRFQLDGEQTAQCHPSTPLSTFSDFGLSRLGSMTFLRYNSPFAGSHRIIQAMLFREVEKIIEGINGPDE